MAKKDKTMTMIIVLAAVGIIGYILYKSSQQRASQQKLADGGSLLPDGCYPFEEVHEIDTIAGEMWLSIIPHAADGTTSTRPPANAVSIGDTVSVSNTGSALDGTYTVNSIYYSADTGEIGSFRVDVPGGYNFNYNAWQGDHDPRDMTYFGIGHICIN